MKKSAKKGRGGGEKSKDNLVKRRMIWSLRRRKVNKKTMDLHLEKEDAPIYRKNEF